MSTIDSLDRGGRETAKWFVQVLREAALRPVVTSARRSRRTQEKLYNDYVSGRSRFPAARPGTSKHELGRAFDLFFPDLKGLNVAQQTKALLPVGELWESLGGRWGGRFKDPIHFEW